MSTTAPPSISLEPIRHSRFLEGIVRHLPDPIFVFDALGSVQYLNSKAIELAGGEEDRVLKLRFHDLFEGKDSSFAALSCADVADRPETVCRMRHCDSTSSDILLISSRITDDEANSYLLCFVRPVELFDSGRRRQTPAKISAELIPVRKIPEVLTNVTRMLAEMTEVDHATITLIDEEEKHFIVQVEYPVTSGRSLVGGKIPIQGHATQEELLHEKKPVVAPDVSKHPIVAESKRVAEFVRNLGVRSMLIVPLVYKGRVIGTIGLDSIREVRHFSPAEVEMCCAIADQTAMAIENSRMFDSAVRLQKQYSEAYSAASLDGVADKVLSDLESRVTFCKASMQLIVNGRRVLLGGRGFDKGKASPRLLGRIEFDPIVKSIMDSKQLNIIPDTRLQSGWSRVPETSDVNSWVGVPVLWDSQPIALITLDHDQFGFYAKDDDALRNTLSQLASSAAVDIHEAYLFDAAQRQLDAFKLVTRIAEIATAQLEKSDLLNHAVQSVAQAMRSEQCTLFLAENDDDTLIAQAAWPPVTEPHLSRVPLTGGAASHESPIVRAFRKTECVVVGDFQDPETAGCFAIGPGIPSDTQSLLTVPIIIGDQTLGVLAVSHSSKINAFNASDALLLETVMRHTAIAVERDTGLGVVHRVGHQILRATDIDDILKEIVEGAIKVTHTSTGVIYLVDANSFELLSTFHPKESVHPRPRLDKDDGITRTVIRTKQMIELDDITKDPHVNPELRGRYRSMVAIPLVLDDEVKGVLYLNGTRERRLTAIEKWFASTLADQAAIAIQRMQLDQQLRDSETKYHSLVDHIPQYVFRKDQDSRFTYANEKFCKSVGLTSEQIIGKTDFDVYPPELAQAYVEDDKEVLDTGRRIAKTEQNRSKTMKVPINVKVVKTAVRDSEGKISGVQAIFWDVTKETRLQFRYSSLFNQSPDSIVILRNGRIKLANSAATKLFGVKSVNNRNLLDFIDPEFRDLAVERLKKLSQNENVEDVIEMRVLQGDATVDVAVYARPLPHQDGIQVVFHDLTRYNTLLEEMHHRVAKALHEVTQCLANQKLLTPHEEVRDAFRAVERRVIAMAEVHRMIHIQWGTSLVPMDTYLERLIHQVFESHGKLESDSGWNLSASEIALDADQATACGVIVAELVSNALLYAFSEQCDGTIDVRMTRIDGSCTLQVKDSGGGFKDQKRTGSSRGLTLVRRVAKERLKGTIDINTSRDGVSVTVVFPMTPA